MADTISNTGDPRVDAALERIRGKFADLEDAMLVQVQLERRLSEQSKEQAHQIAGLLESLRAEAQERRAMDQIVKQQVAALDARVDKLVSAIGEMISRNPAH